MGEENTPPASPGIPNTSQDDLAEMYDDEVDEVIDVPESEDQGVLDEDEADEEGEEMMELPGGIDQLESLLEEEEERRDESKVQFKGHKGSVFCCSLRKEGLVATGGEDDKCFVWRSSDGVVEKELDGWGDSVTCVQWSKDGNYLAVGDMAGLVRVFKYPSYQQVFSMEVGDLLWLSWHNQGASVLFAGTQDSNMWMWKIPSGESKLFTGAGAGAQCAEVLSDGRRAVVGYSDGTVRQWDLKSGEVQLQYGSGAGCGHIDEVVSVAGHRDRELVVSGAMDGVAVLWSSGSGKQLGSLLCGEKQEENSAHSVEAVATQDGLVVTGTLGGRLGVWDISSQVARHNIQVGEGVTGVKVSQSCVYVSTLCGAVRMVDLRSGAPVAELRGSRGSVLDFQMSESNIVTAGDDGVARVFDYRSPP